MKRALLVVGAGASVEYKSPSTAEITQEIELQVSNDKWMQKQGGDKAFRSIKTKLEGHLNSPKDVNFEHIYHCAHEIIYSFGPSNGAVNEYRPILYPFIEAKTGITPGASRVLCQKIVEIIYEAFSAACSTNPLSLTPLSNFLSSLQEQYFTRIYTTNYDDFFLQADPKLYTGFPSAKSSGPKRFDLKDFLIREDENAIFHLHGSVHMGFSDPISLSREDEVGDLFWFDDRNEARNHATFNGSDVSRMDGTSFMRTSVITGLDKLSRIQQRPFSHYYAAMARDAMRADIIYVIGSGLTDLHVNTWLREARSGQSPVPIIIVDYWNDSFLDATAWGDHGSKEIRLFHDLKVHCRGPRGGESFGKGWTLSSDLRAGIWDKGFQNFLNSPDELAAVLKKLKL